MATVDGVGDTLLVAVDHRLGQECPELGVVPTRPQLCARRVEG